MGHIIVQSVYHHYGQDCVITTGMDGTHSHGSEHYTGLALDYRLHNVPQATRELIVAQVRESLGPDFDVIWEALGTPNEHLHVEYDPKGAY
jgi:hypothetical protein